MKKTYFAFFRGVNVGGHTVKMAELKKVLESLGLSDVKTFFASGNASFSFPIEKESTKPPTLIEEKLRKKFGFKLPLILRTRAEVEKLIFDDPFKKIMVDSNTRLYVTFLKEKTDPKFKIPYTSMSGAFRIIKISNTEIFSVLQLDAGGETADLMSVIEKEYGKNVTTRNWNTVMKMIA